MKRCLFILTLFLSFCLLAQPSAMAIDCGCPDSWKGLAKASSDECFYGVGECNIYPFQFGFLQPSSDGPYINDGPQGVCYDGRPKRNEAYVWGLTH